MILARSQSIINQWEAHQAKVNSEEISPPLLIPKAASKKSTNKGELSTSTPTKPGKDMEFLDGDLIGPVLQLPETTNPFKIISDMYQELYEYFGDSLAAKLPIRHLQNIYIQGQKEVYVSLGDDECKKSGEELLQQLLNSATPEMPSVQPDDTEMKSENHSYEQTMEEMDFDEKSEPSERSEQSSRSSRSDRSHSDENLSFLGDDTDLTVKATVSDPSMGIKLTITKRPKAKESCIPANVFSPPEKPDPKLEARRTKRRELRMKELFEGNLEPDQPRDVSFTFRFQGREQRCMNRGRRMQHSVCCSSSDTNTTVMQNECRKLGLMMRPYGRHRRLPRPRLTRSRSAMHLFSSDINNVI